MSSESNPLLNLPIVGEEINLNEAKIIFDSISLAMKNNLTEVNFLGFLSPDNILNLLKRGYDVDYFINPIIGKNQNKICTKVSWSYLNQTINNIQNIKLSDK
jgi:hypothetical protein